MPVNTSELADTAFRSILDDEQLAYLAERFTPRKYAIGATIVRTGQPVRTMHVIRKGRVLLYTENDRGERVLLRECRDGEQFGEIALLEESPSPFTAMVAEETQLLNLDRRHFEELLARYPQIGRELLKLLSERLRTAFEALRLQSTTDIDERLNQTESGPMKLARWVSRLVGSWLFFVVFGGILALWMILGRGISWPIYIPPFDPFPYTLLILMLSTLAAIQAPIILVVVNGLNQQNRLRDKRDFENEARLEMQIANLHAKADEANRLIEDQLDPERVARLETEIARLRASLEEQRSVFEDRLARVSRTISTPGDEIVPATN